MSNYFDLQNGPILTTPSSITVPKISTIGYPGDDTAADPAGGQTITLTGAGFEAGASVIINGNAVGVVSVVSNTTITFTSPANSAGSYVLYVVNTDGGTAVAVPGIQYSGVPNWTTAAGSLGSYTETVAIANTVTATGDAPITYSLFSGSLPTGATLNSSTGLISGTSPLAASPTTFTFTIRATDAQQQDTNRSFSLTINPDVVTWSSPANGTTYTSVANSAISNVALSASAASGQGIVYTANALPTGLSISGSNITGTPTVVANSSTLLTATANTTNATATRTINWIINVASDAFFPYVTSLLSANTPASTFVADASTNNFNVVAYNDARPSNFGPYTPGYYSNFFDGTGDYLTAPQNAAFNFSTGAFTVESWVYITGNNGTNQRIVGLGDGAVGGGSPVYTGWALNFTNSLTQLSWYRYDGTETNLSASFSFSLNTWYHIVAARNGSSNLSFFVNGTRIYNNASASLSYNNVNSNPLYIGAQYDGAGGSTSWKYFNGYISNTRVVAGTAVYDPTLTTLTVPVIPLTAIANTSLLTCQSNRFIDNSTNNFTITRNGDTLVSGFDPFAPSGSFAGLGSGYFDGSGDYLDTPSSSAFVLGSSGNFTIECWIYPNGTPSSSAIVVSTYTDFNPTSGYFNKWNLGFSTATVLTWYDDSGNAGINASSFPINVWSHVAVVRNGATITMYVNGVSVGTQSSLQNYTSQSPVRVGLVPNAAAFNGYISNLRIVKGTAVYTANFTPPTSSLTAIANTQLLILQNNQPNNNSMFLDNSTSNFNITRNGNTTQGSFSPYGGGWSTLFSSGNYLTYNPGATAAFGTGNFTVEAWVFATDALASGDNPYICDTRGGGGAWSFSWNFSGGSNPWQLAWGNGSLLQSSTSMNINTWNHCAYVRSGTTGTLYLNGVSIGTWTDSVNYSASVTSITIGRRFALSSGTQFLPGYLSNLRIVKGTAVYTTAFTPPTSPLTAITNTVLLTCADNRFIDDSANGFAITTAGTPSVQRFNPWNPVITTPTSYSGYFDGTGDYLSVATANAAGLSKFLTGNFTVECWAYLTDISVDRTIISAVYVWGAGANYNIEVRPGALMHVQIGSSITLTSGTVSWPLNQWNHVALVRTSTTSTVLYLNGVSVATSSTNWTADEDCPVTVGCFNINGSSLANYWNGYISNLRIVNGTGVYTGNFTPPTAPLTAIANTSFLTLQSATIIDNSVNNVSITSNGYTVPRQFNPFGWTNTTGSSAAYTPALYSGSAYFDGSGDGLVISAPPATLRSWATGDFTVEAWVYPTSFTGWSYNDGQIHSTLVGNRSTTTTGDYWSFGPCTDGVVRFYYYNGSSAIAVSSGLSISLNQWSHVAFTKTSSGMRFYVNGVASGFTAISGTPVNGSDLPFTVGVANNTVLTGYVSDLRIVNGTAVYRASFALPVAPLTAVQNTSLLTNMASAAIYDSAMLTNYETSGNASVVTSLKKYGNSSLYFDGTGDYLPAQTSPNFAFGTGDFTVEAWVYTADVSFSAQRGFIQTSATVGGLSTSYTSGIIILFGGSSFGSVNANVGGSNYNSGGSTVATNTWYHVALTRASGVVNLWLNGVSVASGSGNTANLTGQNLVVGGYYSTGYLYNGYLDDVRITRGLARYTSTFTPPSTPVFTN